MTGRGIRRFATPVLGRPRRAVFAARTRVVVAILCVVTLAPVVLPAAPPAGAQAPAGPQPATDSARRSAMDPTLPVTVRITGVSPRTPAIRDGKPQRVTVTAQLTNTGKMALPAVAVYLQRGNPIVQQKLLEDALANPVPTADVSTPPVPMKSTLAAGGSVTVTLRTSTAADGGLCLECNPGVYPVDVVASATDPTTGITQELGRAQTFLSSFVGGAPQPVRASWVWPLIDRPHRGLRAKEFTDDQLATSVAPGGRLDRALRVAEAVGPTVVLTLLIDPELIESLKVMTGGYTVRTATGSRSGTGAPAAARWLRRLSVVARYDDVSLTAYADPDIDALARADLGWSTSLDSTLSETVTSVLGHRSVSDLVWPAGSAVTSKGLDALVGNGASLVVLSDAALPGTRAPDVTPDALSTLPSLNGTADALVTSSTLQRSVLSALSATGGEAALQVLLARLAVRAEADPRHGHYVVMTPDRYVDTDPARAAAVITSIAHAGWARVISAHQAAATVRPVDRGSVQPPDPAEALGSAQTDAVTHTLATVETMRDCLTNTNAPRLLSDFPPAVSRAESAAWRTDRAGGLGYARDLLNRAQSLVGGVRIVQPAQAAYQLASSNAPIPVTVENTLPVPVQVRIQVAAAPGERGFNTSSVAVQTIAAATRGGPVRQQVPVPTRLDRNGRFKIVVSLRTPQGAPLGPELMLRVSSTALGGIALWITGTAFTILLIALAVRWARRIRHRHDHPPVPTLRPPADPVIT